MPLTKIHFGALETLLTLDVCALGVHYSHNLAIPQAKTETILLNQCEKAGVRFGQLIQKDTGAIATAIKRPALMGRITIAVLRILSLLGL